MCQLRLTPWHSFPPKRRRSRATPPRGSPRSSRCGVSPTAWKPARSSVPCARAGHGPRSRRRWGSAARPSTRSTPSASARSACARGAGVFERFTRDSRRVVVVAQDAASRLGAEQVEPEHLLLALARGCEDPAALALAEVGVNAGAIAQAIEDDLVAMLEVVG